MAGFDNFLTIAIPAGIIIWIGIKMYHTLSKDNPNWFANFREWMAEKTEAKSTKIDPMHQGSIQYGT